MHATMQLSNELLQSHRGGFVATTDCYSQDIGIFVGGGGGGERKFVGIELIHVLPKGP